ncbi:MAG: methylated-DNA--[protein]-cysteine S-methyltransferase [Candidatus Coatesbacteria bacterium]|nr:MAG: methylated-DNA--[protein]-cysteine S-methyltransferase [Candidatus Coatesbacteria bacterium]
MSKDAIYISRFSSTLGEFTTAATDSAILSILMPGFGDRGLVPFLIQKFPGLPVVERPNELGESAREQILEYLDGRHRVFDLPIDMNVTDFQSDIYSAMRAVPYGAVVSYGELATAAGYRGAAQATGSACSANPLPLIQPCHRIVAANGPGGYGANLPLKLKLLEIEGVDVSRWKK